MKKFLAVLAALCLMTGSAFAAKDTGVVYQMAPMQSLALGGFVASTAFMLKMPLFIVIVGVPR